MPEHFGFLIGQLVLQQLEAGIEERNQDRHFRRRLVVGPLVEVVLPEVDDLELGLFTVGKAVQEPASGLVARPPADHLPQLDARLHRLHKDEVDYLGNVDAGVEHVHRNGEARQVVFLELGDESVAIAAVAHPLGSRGDDHDQADVLGVHLLEDFADAVRVLFGHGENDGLTRKLAGLVLEADLHDLFPLLAQGVLDADRDLDFGALVVEGVRVDALLDEGVAFLFAQVHALDAIPLKAGLRLIQAEIHEELVFHRPLVLVEEGRCAALAMENPESVPVDELGRRGGEADHPGVEVFDDFGEPLERSTDAPHRRRSGRRNRG